MSMTRREFLGRSAAGIVGMGLVEELMAAKESAAPGLRVGVCDWSIGAKGRKALDLARTIGLDGVQISPRGAGEKLSFTKAEEIEEYKKAVKETGVQIASVALGLLNEYPLASDPRGPGWLEQTIDAAAALGCTATLLAFFGRGDLRDAKGQLKGKDVDAVVGRLKDAAPRAKQKGVFLGIENWLSAADNLKILDRVGSDHVQVYYDIANSTVRGYDVPAEIRSLKGRICEFHLKNTDGLFGERGVKMPPVVEAVREIGYTGWLVMEQHFGKDMPGYFRANAAYIRKAFGLEKPSR